MSSIELCFARLFPTSRATGPKIFWSCLICKSSLSAHSVLLIVSEATLKENGTKSGIDEELSETATPDDSETSNPKSEAATNLSEEATPEMSQKIERNSLNAVNQTF